MMFPRPITALVVVICLALVHGLVHLLARSLVPFETNLVLFASNLYVAYCVWLILRDGSSQEVGLFGVGYMVLFLLVLVLLQRDSLFILLIILYASVYRVRLLLGVFVAFVLAYVVFQPYAFETFFGLAGAYVAVWYAWRSWIPRFVVFCLAFGLGVLAFILLPVMHLLVQDAPQTLLVVFSRADVLHAIWISLSSSALATLLTAVWGIPLAYGLVRSDFRGKSIIETVIDLPILIPQSVVGIALLSIFGPGSPLGAYLESLGLGLSGSFAGIVLAQVFVACPFLIKTAMTAFSGVPKQLENVSWSLGVGPVGTFFRVALPLAGRGIFVGFILAWARAISEFGALMLFAAHPQTAPILAHNEFLRAGLSEARPIAVVLLLVCLWVFILLQFGKTFVPSVFVHRDA